ncbi:hypothetical protein O3P69_015148 [Scylla paramamosain]|uniref:Serine/threonine-protein kinase ATR n=1 Tax=Scylla paramamosain TaxID=85552 RepID=A0AAW0T3H5_SCYPA
MTEHISDTSQNTALRDKFVSVVGPVFDGGDEENVLTLLTSLANVCCNDAGLLVKPLDDDTIKKDSAASDSAGKDKASEFTCWLLAELMTVHGSLLVCQANVDLQVTIMRLLDSRNPRLFLLIVKDYLRIGLEGKEVLFGYQSVSVQSFASVVDPDTAQLKPKTIRFDDNSQVDDLLSIIILVLSQLGDLLHHFGPLLDDIWLLVISCLEGGDTNLKMSALIGINHLMDTCGLPVTVERIDYFMQCIGGTVLLHATSAEPHSTTGVTVASSTVMQQHSSSGGTVISLNERTITDALAGVVLNLKEHIPELIPFLQEEFLVTLYRIFSPSSVLEKIPVMLRRPLVECFFLLVDSLSTASPHFTQATTVFEACVSHSILIPEVGSLLLRKLVLDELVDALPTPVTSTLKLEITASLLKKRKYSDMEYSVPPVSVTNISKWWKMAIQKLNALFADWSESSNPPLEQIEAVNAIISNSGWLSAHIPSFQVSLKFLPEAGLIAATDALTTVMTSTEDICKIVEMMKLLVTLGWSSCIVEPDEVKSSLCHSWLALATLPWMAAEVTWMDLKPINSRNFAQWSTRIKWINDPRVRTQCVAVVALLPDSVAPRWRCHVVRSLINEHQPQVMVEVAAWFPMMIHQLHGANGQHLFGEVTGVALHSSDTATVLAVARCFRPLLCALLNLTSIKSLRNNEDNEKPYTLHCQVCNEGISSHLGTQGVDSTLVSRFLGLLGHPQASVIVAVVEALPTILTHSTLTSHMISQYLALLTHQDKAVVSALCEQLPALVCIKEQNPSQDSKSLIVSRDGEIVISHFSELVKKSENDRAASAQPVIAVLEALKHIVRFPLGGLTGGVLVLLLRCLFLKVRTVSSSAHLIIHSLAKTLDLSLKDLFARHRQALSQVLAAAVCQGEVAGLLNHIADVFKWPEISVAGKRSPLNTRLGAFISSQLHYLLPALVVRAAKESKPCLLQELASCLGYRLRDILIDHFQHILAHLVFHHSEEEQEAVLDFIAATTEIQIHNIRRCSVQNQVNELVLGLHDHKSAVLCEFHHMRTIDTSFTSTASISSGHASSKNFRKKSISELSDATCQEEICEYLAPRLLGILGFLDSKLVSSSTMFKEKRSGLWSLNDLLALMGKKYISPVSRKVLASLKTALKLKDDEFYDISCHAWTTFLLNLDECTLESLVEEVVVVIMPLIQKRPEQMEPVLTHVLVETPSVKPLLGNLPLLPMVEGFARINEAIMEKQSRIVGGNFEEVLQHLSGILRNLNHESVDVRLLALGQLRHTLHHNQAAVHHLTTASDYVHPTVSELFSALLGQCREVDDDVQVLVAECLGLLGAIDPSRLYSYSNIKEELNEIHLNIEHEAFIIQLITELGRAFLAATDASTQTCASYALQEITRLYGIRESGSEEATAVGSRAWEKLRYHLQEIIRPLLTSKYTVATGSGRPTPALPSPIFGSPHAASFHQWLTCWECSLVDMLKGERASQVFSVCKPILRRDTTTAMYLLPFILVCVLCEAQQFHSHVLDEVFAVMNHMQEKEDDSKKEDSSAVLSSEFRQLAVQTVFSALDYISKWTQKQRQAENLGKKGRGAFVPSTELQQVLCFLENIPADILAQTSFKTQAYSRALLHIEAFLKDNSSQLKEHLHFLQCIYVSLDEPDGVAGVAAIRREDPSLEEQVIQHEATGQLQDALGCYERLCVSQGTEAVYKGLLECYISLDQPHSVFNITQGLLSTRPELEPALNKYRVEAAWRLSKWDELDNFLKTSPEEPSWGVGVGQVLRALRARDQPAYLANLKNIRAHYISMLSAASMEKWAYQRAYPYILRLHMLTELEEMVSGLLCFNPSVPETPNSSSNSNSRLVRVYQLAEVRSEVKGQKQQYPCDVGQLVDLWDKRLRLIQTSHRYLEPVLSFQRTLLALGSEWLQETNPTQSTALKIQVERKWLHSAKVARKSGHTQQGEWALLGAGFGRDVFVERAKWHWVKGEHHQAVTTLNRGIDKFFPASDAIKGDNSESSQEERLACGRAKLLLAKYSEEAATLDGSTIKQYYRDACEMNRQWEDGHFHLAMYYDRILSSLEKKEKPVEWIHHIILSFGKSLQHGCCHIYQSMPRMLGLWLEFGTRVSELEVREGKSLTSNASSKNSSSIELLQEKLTTLNAAIGSMVDRLPHYMLLTALPQLISRICHSHNDVFKQLCKIIATMLSTFPQQAMWHMVAVSKSSYHMRVARCSEIFEAAKKINPNKFLELSNKPIEKGVPQVSLNNLLRSLPRLLADSSFSNIMLPLQHQMAVTLPSANIDIKSHNPFPRTPIYLSNIEDKVEIMQSLQLPKKITLRGSDGKCYIMMCKPKDDLRKDCRLMEFNNFVNRLLLRDPESRKRDLHIRTYAVVPLNEECGLIEWIENLNGLRQILHRLYKDSGNYMSAQELKQNMCKRDTPLSTKREVYLNKLVPRHPPVFGTWFLRTFPDPQAWLRARLAYCRTTAVMSMVGYILGLGDRHGENVLFDASCGDTVHVDFNCLFNKGETFDFPERVPFRLTHNMVAAMGPTGHEGIYRKSCEVTMRVMREEREALMSVLHPFIHDPLVEWSRGNKSARMTGEINNEKAQMHVTNIEHRLSGQIRSKARGLNQPLSVEGQVNSLIEEATSIDNLCQMYIGWAAYM